MKKILKCLCSIIFCTVIALGLPQMAKAAEVAINETNFPELMWLAKASDIDHNGVLSEDEIAKVTSLEMYTEKMTTLQGIEYFTDLIYLECSDNQLATLDVSNNTALTILGCYGNQLTALDVSKNTALTRLGCFGNQIKVLNVSNNPALIVLECGSNQLTALNVSKSTALDNLQCYGNQLTTLDVSNNTALTGLDCSYNQLTTLDVSKNTALTDLNCSYNQLTELRLNKKVFNTLPLYAEDLHGNDVKLSDLQNVTKTKVNVNDNNEEDPEPIVKTKIEVIDIKKPATYQYSDPNINNGDPIKFKIFYDDTKNDDENNFVIPHCSRIFHDYEYKNPVSGTAVTIYGNGVRQTVNGMKVNTKEFIAYTDILASYNYILGGNGKVKASVGKVIAGITMSDKKPTLNKNKIVDSEAAKIAKAKIRNGQITVTATGKAGGVVYLWVIDTGNKDVSECCPINVKLAPKKLEVQEITGSKANKLKIANGNSKEVKIAGLVGSIKTEDCTYTATVASSSQNYVSVTTSDDKNFTLKGIGLKKNKDTKVSITFTCKENGKKAKFTAMITK